MGIYFLMNLLLAIFSSNYKARRDQSINKYEIARENYLVSKFHQYDQGNKNYLTKDECRELIVYLLSLDPSHSEENINVDKFVYLLDKDKNDQITLNEFYSYFEVMDLLLVEKRHNARPSHSHSTFQGKLRKIIKNPIYDLCIYIVLIANLIMLFIRDVFEIYGTGKEDIKVWIAVQNFINM